MLNIVKVPYKCSGLHLHLHYITFTIAQLRQSAWHGIQLLGPGFLIPSKIGIENDYTVCLHLFWKNIIYIQNSSSGRT